MTFIAVLVIALYAVVVVDVARTPVSVWKAADQNQIVWLLVVLLLPLFGAIAYLLIARPILRGET